MYQSWVNTLSLDNANPLPWSMKHDIILGPKEFAFT